jgi:putative thiazole-containing bacteriocin maturation protein
MTNLNYSMRPKLKMDTFLLYSPNGSAYFRNNESSFRMEGEMIDHFVQDMSQDTPHQLPEGALKEYASQIEFLDNYRNSSAYRFQSYRQAKVLVVGSGPFLISVISKLLVSGMPKFHVLVTGTGPTDRQRMQELAAHALKTDPEVRIEEITLLKKGVSSLREAVRPFDSILFVSQEGDIEELRVLHAVCREERKLFFPAVCLQQVGLAGPLVHPDFEGCWESAFRRIHEPVIYKDPRLHTFSSTAGAMLAMDSRYRSAARTEIKQK